MFAYNNAKKSPQIKMVESYMILYRYIYLYAIS